MPPSFEELRSRIEKRKTEPERIINERLEKAKKEIGIKDFYQYSVINNTPEQCAEDIKKIIVEHLK